MKISKNKIVLLLSGVFLTVLSYGQSNEYLKLNELGKYYNTYYSRNEPSENVIKAIKLNVPDKLGPTADFIIETTNVRLKIP